MIHYTLYIILFLSGLSVGSFLNAVIFRLEEGESVIWSDGREGVKGAKNNSLTAVIPKIRLSRFYFRSHSRSLASSEKLSFFWNNINVARSYCPHCRKTLKWHDLIPVFSFLFLRGKCRYCGEKISWQYPLIEIATGLIFLLISNFQFRISNQFLIFNFRFIIDFIY